VREKCPNRRWRNKKQGTDEEGQSGHQLGLTRFQEVHPEAHQLRRASIDAASGVLRWYCNEMVAKFEQTLLEHDSPSVVKKK